MIRVEEQRSTVHVQAFGITFRLHDDDLDLAGVSPAYPSADPPPTEILRDPAGLRERWSVAEPTRMREQREDQRLLLSVDHDTTSGYLLHAPTVGAALVSPDGRTVRCAPEEDTESWRALVVGQVLPLVATVRGLEVFHASGVVIGERSYLLCAAPGVGKTSLAMHLVMAGAGLLSDDAVAVDDALIAHPGAAVLHVREQELERLGPGGPTLRRLGTMRGRATFAPERRADAHPVGGIYLLERSTATPAIAPVPHSSPFPLLASTFNLSVRTPARLVHQLELCAQIIERVPIFGVRIGPGHGASDLASMLAAHVDDRAPTLV